MNFNVYEDISKRTNGDIYLGVVGPVRTGKSTFIKKFMEKLVIPKITHEFEALRAIDELPQSGSGRSVMTTEPKFVPNEAISIPLDENSNMKVRLIDCVGYLVDDVIGFNEEGVPRMVMTPWSETPVTFTKAAEIGTQKVINDHSTIGILVTTDGSIVDISREKYVAAEERVVNELKAINKPFVILLNSINPNHPDTILLKEELSAKYDSTVIPIDIFNMEEKDITYILKEILYEFPIKEIHFNIPIWLKNMNENNGIKKDIMELIIEKTKDSSKIRDILSLPSQESQIYLKLAVVDLGKGEITFNVELDDQYYYDTINAVTSAQLNNRLNLLEYIYALSETSNAYNKIKTALDHATNTGYGIVMPDPSELKLENPEVFNQGHRFGMKLKASAPSIHLIRAYVDTEVTPYIGTESECERIMQEMIEQYENDPEKILQMEIFGKNLNELVINNLHGKISKLSNDTQDKLRDTLSKVLNENGKGIVFIFI
ncbi:MAG: stage IV sporulation protein A [Eubacteriales bacterium]